MRVQYEIDSKDHNPYAQWRDCAEYALAPNGASLEERARAVASSIARCQRREVLTWSASGYGDGWAYYECAIGRSSSSDWTPFATVRFSLPMQESV